MGISAILDALEGWAGQRPGAVAIRNTRVVLSYARLHRAVEELAACLSGSVLGLLTDNGPVWTIIDLAAQGRAITCVPLPSFFTDQQLAHAIHDAGIDVMITDNPGRIETLCAWTSKHVLSILDTNLVCLGRPGITTARYLGGISKITYTSGTTGEPKGVCLRQSAIDRVAMSLCEVVGTVPQDRALGLLPPSILLQNIAGIYAPLLAGAEIAIPQLIDNGITSVTDIDITHMLHTFSSIAPTTVVLVPQQLQIMITAAEAGFRFPASLRFAAVGGAPVSLTLLERAARVGLPVYEGYGLSEACSVVCLNHPDAWRRGSVGRPLPHVDLRIAEDGEVLVRGALFDGYTGEVRHSQDNYWPTGDLGMIDADGYLTLTGRKKSSYATSYGRNVAPEWVERELLSDPAIAQAAVFGEARPYNVAVLVPGSGMKKDIGKAVTAANLRLPDYARVHRYILVNKPFTRMSGELTGNGRLRRHMVWNHYHNQLHNLYEEQVNATV